MTGSNLPALTRTLVKAYGPNKPMGASAPDTKQPHFFMVRRFASETDLMIIFNTKRCHYQCYFCQLPAKSLKRFVPTEDILAQFEHVLEETKHSLGVIERVSIGNEGSVLDTATFPADAMLTIARSLRHLPRLQTVVLETRLEYIDSERLRAIHEAVPHAKLTILTGFETHDPHIRDRILGKREPLEVFEQGLDRVGECGANLTAYVLYKPDPSMNDEQAYAEAERSIDYLAEQCAKRGIALSIRLNPMYIAQGSRWSREATAKGGFLPPRLSEVSALAERKIREGIPVYIGLSNEGLSDEQDSYKGRDDYSPRLTLRAMRLNEGILPEAEQEPTHERVIPLTPVASKRPAAAAAAKTGEETLAVLAQELTPIAPTSKAPVRRRKTPTAARRAQGER